MVEVAAVGLNGERPCETRRMMIQNVSMIGTPSTSSATATLAVPRIGQHRQRVAHREDAGGADEDAGGVEVPGQEAGQRAGEHARTAAPTMGCGWTPRMLVSEMMPSVTAAMSATPGGEPVEAVDEVDAVDHAHDPQRRERDRAEVGDAAQLRRRANGSAEEAEAGWRW